VGVRRVLVLVVGDDVVARLEPVERLVGPGDDPVRGLDRARDDLDELAVRGPEGDDAWLDLAVFVEHEDDVEPVLAPDDAARARPRGRLARLALAGALRRSRLDRRRRAAHVLLRALEDRLERDAHGV